MKSRWKWLGTSLLVPVALVLLLPWLVSVLERGVAWRRTGGPFASLRTRIERYVVDSGVPSISVAAAKGGKIVWEESFGWANVERRIRATPHTMYALASTTKALTATGVMVLVERGLVDIDRPVEDYVGDVGLRAFEGSLSDVTLRRIFTHTSGLPRYWSHHYESELAQQPSTRELVRRYGILVSAPGERYIYSNVGIGLAELIIEEVSGRAYAEFMRSEVFVPLGLEHTAIITRPYDEEGIAQKYAGGERLPFYDMGFHAAGSAWTSAHDLVSFGMFHLKDHLPHQKPILLDGTIDQMYAITDPRMPDHYFHFPWIEYRYRGFTVMEFGGHVIGGKVSFRLVPSEDIAVVVMSNGEEADTQKVSNWVLNRLLPGFSRIGILKFVGSRLKSLWREGLGTRTTTEGQWVGEITTWKGRLPLRLNVDSGSGTWLRLPDQPGADGPGEKPVPERPVRRTGGSFSASFPAQIPTTDTLRARHYATFDLRLRGNRLAGPVYAESQGMFFWLPFYVSLRRVQ